MFFVNLLFASFPSSASVLDSVKERGFLKCGINVGVVGFSETDINGDWNGFDIDLCKAISAAIFDDPSKVQYTPLNAKERFTTLQSGQIDVLSRNTSWTLLRDTVLGITFRPITYFDGQGFMIRKRDKDPVSSVLELSNASICVQAGTTTELSLSDYFSTHGMKYHPIVFERVEEVGAAYNNNRCDAYTADKSALYAFRITTADPNEHVILPEIISKEPLGPAVGQGDINWLNIVTWVHYALVNAEEFGITKENVDTMRNSNNPDIKRFLGSEKNSNLGAGLKLSNDWTYRIIKHMGNYGEIFDRNLGEKSALKIPRGHNALWTHGGLMIAPPIR
nr:amino acid ABC transporter substrate-binding protein [Candidatus Liberibacter sp.]